MELDDREIVAAIRDNPEKGFSLLMKKYIEPVYWHIRRLVVSHADAQDAAQETFVRAFRSFGSFCDGSLRSWIYRIATNEALRSLSGRRSERYEISDAFGLFADEYVDYSDLESVKLQQAILSLPHKQQLAFNLRYYDEMDYDEIARITGSTAVNVKVNYHLAKSKIIKYIKTHD